MPQYTYKCYKCSHIFEKNLPVKDYKEPTLSVCPRCGEYTVKKQIDSVTFTINGYSEKNGYSKKE